MAKPRDIIAEIISEVPPPSRCRWYQRGTPEQLELIGQVSEAWLSGRLPQVGRRVAPVVAAKFRDAGIEVSAYGVREWLASLRRTS